VVVKAMVENFKLAPAEFGGEPALGEGHIRFSLNRVPDCVDPVKLERALNSPIGKGRLVGASFDYARYSGPNGVLAEQLDVAGSYSPATRPEIPGGGGHNPPPPPPPPRRPPGRRSSTTASPPASTGWSSRSPRTTAPPRPFTPSPISRSSPNRDTRGKSARGARSPAPRPPNAGSGKPAGGWPGSPQDLPEPLRSPILHFV
jgi:hypothetical protein